MKRSRLYALYLCKLATIFLEKLCRCFFRIGGPYEAFGGRDASRALARFAVDAATDKYDDLSDLNTTEMNSIKEWEEQFKGESFSI